MANPYMFETVNPMDVALRGFQGIQVLRQNQQQSALLQAQQEAMQAQVRKAEQEMAEAQRFQTDMARLYRQFETGNVRPETVLSVIAANPQLSEPIQKLMASQTEQERIANFQTANDLYTAAEIGDAPRFTRLIDNMIAAAENEGDADGAQVARGIKQTFERDPASAKTTLAMQMAYIDPDRFKKQIDASQAYRLAPGQLEKQQGELRQQAAELGLTQAQTAKVQREVAETNARIAAIRAQAEAAKNAGGGFVPPADRFKAEGDLRKEYQTRSASFRDAYKSFQDLSSALAQGTGAGDTAAITMFRRLLDPGSVVRETEFAQTQSIGGVLNRLDAFTRSVQGKGLLNDRQRAELEAAARPFIEAAVATERKERANFERMVREYGLNPNNIFSATAVEMPRPIQPAQPVTTPAPRGDRMQNRAPARPAEGPQILEIRPRGE